MSGRARRGGRGLGGNDGADEGEPPATSKLMAWLLVTIVTVCTTPSCERHEAHVLHSSGDCDPGQLADTRRKPETFLQAIEAGRKAFGKTPNVLVNAAGVPSGGKSLHEFDDAEWEKVFAVNYWAPLRGWSSSHQAS